MPDAIATKILPKNKVKPPIRARAPTLNALEAKVAAPLHAETQ